MQHLALRSLISDFEGKSRTLKSATFCLLLLSVFFIPLSAEMHVTKTTLLQFPLELLVPVTTILAAGCVLLNWQQFRFAPTDFAVLLFLGAALLSSVFSVLPQVSFKALVVLSSYAATFYFTFRFLNLNEKQWQLVWRVFMLSFTALMVYTLFRYFSLGIHRKHSYEMSLPFIPGHTLLIAIGFPVFLYAMDRLIRRVDLKWNLAFVLLFAFITAISYSRLYWVVLLVSGFVLIFAYFKKVRVAMIVASTIVIIAGAILYYQVDTRRNREGAWNNPDDHNSFFVQVQSIFWWGKNESNVERSNRWKVAREIFTAHPVTGGGLNTYPEIYFWYKDYADIEETNLSCTKMNAHQVYRGWLADMGVIGFVSGVMLFLSFLILVLKVRGSPHFVFAALLFLNFVMLGAIEDYTTLEKIMAVFWISLAFMSYLNFNRKLSS